ncbi:MAG: ABC transporter substrate-binding protein [Candidatus Scalindua sp.]|nr:ABC transporter substrate-binding protein [Candidatus Scalindua sp.]
MRNSTNVFLICLLLFLSAFSVASSTLSGDTYADVNSKPISPAPSNHAIYSKYDFSNTEEVFNLGTQPFFSPTGLITETMKRDNVLHKALSELGIKARFFPFLNGNDVNLFLRRGDIDAGIGGDMPTITAAATSEIVVTSLIQQGFTSILAKHPIMIRKLKGKKIGYTKGSNAHYALLRALASDGLDVSQVQLIPMDVDKMPEALSSGEIAAFSAWEPTPTITLNKYHETTVIHKYISSGFMYFTKTFSENHPEAVRHIIAAEVRALKWLRSNRENLLLACDWSIQASKALANREIGLTVAQGALLAAADIISYTGPPFIPNRDLSLEGPLRAEFQLLKAIGKVPTSTRWEKVYNSFDLNIMSDILTGSRKYKINEFNYNTE